MPPVSYFRHQDLPRDQLKNRVRRDRRCALEFRRDDPNPMHVHAYPQNRPLPGRSVLLALLVLSGSCTTTSDLGHTMQVEVLDEWFVRVDGDRLARDEFVFRIRGRCRQAKAAGSPPPSVLLTWAALADQKAGRELMNQLLLAGVKSVTLGS